MYKKYGWILSLSIGAIFLGCQSQPTITQDILRKTGIKGGLVVYLGCKDGERLAELGEHEGFLVHGLDKNPNHVQSARTTVKQAGVYGRVSIDQLMHNQLPYTDNLVNLIIADTLYDLSMDEISRVLCPNGVAYIKKGQKWTKIIKPRSKDMDEWTHYLHGADNNAVSADKIVGPPYHIQWTGQPKWARSHEHLASMSVAVSAKGRLFYIVDKAPTASVTLPAQWYLVARDAFNGVTLWEKPVEPWEGHMRGFRTGPAEISRRLVAVEDRVYITPGYGKPVHVLDAATGEIVRIISGTEGTSEIVCQNDMLYLVLGTFQPTKTSTGDHPWGPKPATRNKYIQVRNAESGELLWEKSDQQTRRMMPLTLITDKAKLYFQNPTHIICLDAQSGEVLWQSHRPIRTKRPAWSTPTLVVQQGVLLSADRESPEYTEKKSSKPIEWIVSIRGGDAPPGSIVAYSAETGEKLWSAPCREGYNSPVDVFVINDLVWTGNIVKATDPGFTQARDLYTGEVKVERPKDQKYFNAGMPHHRCYRNKATENYLLLGRAGVELIDLASGRGIENHWVRGTCQYGIMPANGLLYVPPHSCACFLRAKLNSFNALAPRRSIESLAAGTRRFQGAALGNVPESKINKRDWPTFRHDHNRSGVSSTVVSFDIKQLWQIDLGKRPTSPVVANQSVYIGISDLHTLVSLDTETGSKNWDFTTGGRIDSPPTIMGGYVVFGSADGYVYCLRALDGELVWRFRAAPEDRRVVVYNQLESAWPVHGSVLVKDRIVYTAAGRSSYLDGGIHLYRLNLETGEKLSETIINSRDPQTHEQPDGIINRFEMPGLLSDILSSEDDYVYMRHVKFDLQGKLKNEFGRHLFSPTGFLDDTWWHRSYWLYGDEYEAGWANWWRAGNRTPSGRILVLNNECVYGYGRTFYPRGNAGQWNKGEQYHLFNMPIDQKKFDKLNTENGSIPSYNWITQLPFQVYSMVLTGEVLFIAGPAGEGHKSLKALQGEGGIDLWAVSAKTGKTLAEYQLTELPRFDGMIAANKKLFIAGQNGHLTCYGEVL